MMGCILRSLPLAAAVFLSACASGQQPVEMRIAEEGRVFAGNMNIGPNVQDVQLSSEDGSVKCKGVSLLGYAVPGCGSAGSFRLECSDGRVVAGDWEMKDCTSGSGAGSDNNGNEVWFLLGDAADSPPANPNAATSRHEVIAASAVGADSYLFRIGDIYAAGFGDPRKSVHPVIFEDAHSGLFIVRMPGVSLPMALAATAPTSAHEVFIVLPDEDARVVAVSLEGDGSNMLRVVNAEIRDSSLPVIDADGNVVGLTVHDGDVTRVFGADRLRRYLRIVSSRVVELHGKAMSAEELRQRIMTAR